MPDWPEVELSFFHSGAYSLADWPRAATHTRSVHLHNRLLHISVSLYCTRSLPSADPPILPFGKIVLKK